MARKRYASEEIVLKLRQVDVLTAQGRPVADAIRTRGDGSYVLPLAERVRRAKGQSGEAAERTGDGEFPASQGSVQPDAG